jgi:hypothetical protein
MATHRRRLRSLLAAVVAFAVFTVIVLWLYYPVRPHSAKGWLILYALGIPTWVVMDWLGDSILNSKWLNRLPRAARIALGVPAVLILISIGSVLIFVGAWIIRIA